MHGSQSLCPFWGFLLGLSGVELCWLLVSSVVGPGAPFFREIFQRFRNFLGLPQLTSKVVLARFPWLFPRFSGTTGAWVPKFVHFLEIFVGAFGGPSCELRWWCAPFFREIFQRFRNFYGLPKLSPKVVLARFLWLFPRFSEITGTWVPKFVPFLGIFVGAFGGPLCGFVGGQLLARHRFVPCSLFAFVVRCRCRWPLFAVRFRSRWGAKCFFQRGTKYTKQASRRAFR